MTIRRLSLIPLSCSSRCVAGFCRRLGAGGAQRARPRHGFPAQRPPAHAAGRPGGSRQLPHRRRRHGRRALPLDGVRRPGRQRHPHRRHGPPARDPGHRRPRRLGRRRPGLAPTGCAYVSGVGVSRWRPSREQLCREPRATVVLVYGWNATSGQARLLERHPRRPRRPEPRPSRRFRCRPPPRRTPGRRSWRSRPTAAGCWCRSTSPTAPPWSTSTHADRVRYVHDTGATRSARRSCPAAAPAW